MPSKRIIISSTTRLNVVWEERMTQLTLALKQDLAKELGER